MAIKFKKLPTHLAIIMDGNGRWATKRGMPRNYGHREGVNAIERTINSCLKYGVKYCTFFAFSTENWKRSKEEIEENFSLLREYITKNDELFLKKEVKINYIGELTPFPDDLKSILVNYVKKTKNFDKLTVTFALNYGGRDDLVRTINRIIKLGYENITEHQLLLELDTKNIPEPDFVIRTSGEQRLSNFMLYQMAYSELYFPKVYWPSFNEKHFVKALKIYEKRKRRYGGIS